MNEIYERCKKAADYVNTIIDAKDAIGLILGSGLKELADQICDPVDINYQDIPGFPVSTLSPSQSKYIFGTLKGKKVLCIKTPLYYYEGFEMSDVVMPIRVMKLLGVKFIILTNASGGINTNFKEGTLMFIDDFINFMGENPLRGPNIEEFGLRYPDMTKAIDHDLNSKAKKIAEELGVETTSGVYIGFMGPSFETPAEIRAARTLGADAVGMSTVPEIIAARHCGLPIIGLSCISNMAAGITGLMQTVEEVNETTQKAGAQFRKLILGLIERL
ncbi:MAG: purine-nucleoside phosphorylase [Erysipelotrichaceae bacterium]|nr:purine-nucleoside phosphorylase [Erysipelotrichaceae bacterium]